MKDRIIREIPLIQRYSRHNEDQDYRFRSFLKFQLQMSNAELDRTVQEITDQVWQEIDCLSCGNCCRSLFPVLDALDITRLSKRLGISVREFKSRYVQIAEDRTMMISSSPCPFLGENNACSVYEDRPKACHDFPYLQEPNFRSRTLMMIENCSCCPITFNVWQRLKTRLGRGTK